jgi:HlyD family secretion protein
MKKRIIIGILIIILLGGGFFARRSAASRVRFTQVKAGAVTVGDVKSYLSTTAVIKSKNSKDYYGQQLRVSKVNVKVGDSVRAGQVLVSFDASDLNNSVRQAEIQYNNAVLSKQMLVNSNNEVKNKIADIDKQISEIDKQITEVKKGQNPTDAAKLTQLETQKTQLKQTRDSIKPISNEQLKQSDNQIALAKIALDSARARVSDGKENIVAEFDGVVTAVNVVEGGMGNLAQPAVTVQDIENLKAVVSVGKYDAEKIRLDQPAEVRDSRGMLKGKVSFIDPVAKKSMGASGAETSLNTEIDILDRAESLRVDFDTDINILLGEKTNVIKVPAEAVKSDKSGNAYVFVIEEGRAVERPVKLGLQSDMEAEVLEGLKDGERVILNPVAAIKSGTPVTEDEVRRRGR